MGSSSSFEEDLHLLIKQREEASRQEGYQDGFRDGQLAKEQEVLAALAESNDEPAAANSAVDLGHKSKIDLSRDIDDLDLPLSRNLLRQAGINTLRQLVGKTEGELRGIHWFGKERLAEVIICLDAFGLSLCKPDKADG